MQLRKQIQRKTFWFLLVLLFLSIGFSVDGQWLQTEVVDQEPGYESTAVFQEEPPGMSESVQKPLFDTLEEHWKFLKYLKETDVSLHSFAEVPVLFSAAEGFVVKRYSFDHAKRMFTLEGYFPDTSRQASPDLFPIIEQLVSLFPQAIFEDEQDKENFSITLQFPLNPDTFLRFLHEPSPESLSDLEAFQFDKAVPLEKDNGLLSNIIQPLLAKHNLALQKISFPEVSEVLEQTTLKIFPFTVHIQGFVSDAFSFLQEVKRLERFFTVKNFEIVTDELRDEMPLGRMQITLAAYYRGIP